MLVAAELHRLAFVLTCKRADYHGHQDYLEMHLIKSNSYGFK